MKRQLLFISLFVLFQVLASVASGQRSVRGLPPLNQQVINLLTTKKALIIGNSKYISKEHQLNNPENDANDMAKKLTELGFHVTKRINFYKKDTEKIIDEWGNTLQKDDVALFYYAGHGMEIEGKNYIIPVDASPKHELQVKDLAIDINLVIGWMQKAETKTNIVILDACRDNPFARSWRSSYVKGGLGYMEAPKTFIGFAAAPGKTASDGNGRNGLYTESILKNISKRDTTIDHIFTLVSGEVQNKSAKNNPTNIQVPFLQSSLKEVFYFNESNNPIKQCDSTIISYTYKPHPIGLKLTVVAIGIISGVVANSIKTNFDSKVEQFNTLDKTLPVNGIFNAQSDLDKWNTAYSDAQKAQKTGLLNAMVATSILSLGYELFLLTTKVKVQTKRTIVVPCISNKSLGFAITHKF